MLRIGWFSTGRGEGSQKLLRAAVQAIRDGRVDGEIAFVFCNREPGQYPATDTFLEQVRSYGIPLVTLSDARFRREHNGEPARTGRPLPAWRTEYDSEVASLLAAHTYDVGMLAGYMLIMTGPLFAARPMLNLHPAAPGQPEGTWQDVTWKLIGQRVDHGGVRIHLVTAGLDEGPIVTYCTYPLRGTSIDLLWRQAEGRPVDELREGEGEALPLFQEIRRRGAMRELPLVVETLRALAGGRLRLDGGQIFTGDVRIVRGYDLSPEIESSLANAAPA
ncbi:MAG TPA: formyltransferase family protein [Dehalococcoidia bacterium]|nr:formyltransferase family protein [Dehalococcoidia bacterium]